MSIVEEIISGMRSKGQDKSAIAEALRGYARMMRDAPIAYNITRADPTLSADDRETEARAAEDAADRIVAEAD